MDTFGPAYFGIILLLYTEVVLFQRLTLYCYGPVRTTELVLYREVKYTVSFKRGSTVFHVSYSTSKLKPAK